LAEEQKRAIWKNVREYERSFKEADAAKETIVSTA
jgi:hypothetical protein